MRWHLQKRDKDVEDREKIQTYLIRIPKGANGGGVVAENLPRLIENMNSQIEETWQFPSRQLYGKSHMNTS